jgi:hypothetical protein
VANVSQMTMSQQGAWHIIRMNIQFHNATNQPLVIAYQDGSMVMTDNNGATYQGAGGNPGELQGMGIDRGASTDAQFVLGPGQTSSATFSVARGRPANSPIGTNYAYNLTIDELQTQNGATAIPVRSYNINFANLSPGSASSLTSFGNSFTGGSTVMSSAPTTSTVPATTTTGTSTAVPSTAVATGTTSTTAKPAVATTTTTTAAKPATTTTTTTAKPAVALAQPASKTVTTTTVVKPATATSTTVVKKTTTTTVTH